MVVVVCVWVGGWGGGGGRGGGAGAPSAQEGGARNSTETEGAQVLLTRMQQSSSRKGRPGIAACTQGELMLLLPVDGAMQGGGMQTSLVCGLQVITYRTACVNRSRVWLAHGAHLVSRHC